MKESIELDRIILLDGCTTNAAPDCFNLLRSINNRTLPREMHREKKFLLRHCVMLMNSFVLKISAKNYSVVEAFTTSLIILKRVLDTFTPMAIAGIINKMKTTTIVNNDGFPVP